MITLEEALQKIQELQQELQDERHRHDRYVDFELAQAEQLRKLKEQNRWIPVTERLPEDDLPKGSKVKQIKVLVCYKTNGRWVERTQIRVKGYYYGDRDKWVWVKTSDPISHWKPLPEPPKE